jgi:hypothetical protein
LGGVVIAATVRNPHARENCRPGCQGAQNLRRRRKPVHGLRLRTGFRAEIAGMRSAGCADMATKAGDPLQIPFLVIMWSTLVAGLVMWMVVFMMR